MAPQTFCSLRFLLSFTDLKEIGMEDIRQKYKIKTFLEKTGKHKKLNFENIKIDIYRPSARCAGFFTSEENILFWIKALSDQYYEGIKDNADYLVSWIDHTIKNGTEFEDIEVKISHTDTEINNETLLFTIHVHLTTGVITCLGSCFEKWSTTEFPRLLEKVNIMSKSSDTSMVDIKEDELLTNKNLSELYEITRNSKKSKINNKDKVESTNNEESVNSESLNNENPQYSTPRRPIHQRRNSLDSTRGLLSNRKPDTIAEMKVIISDLEIEVVELKANQQDSIQKEEYYNDTLKHLHDKIVQQENSFKAEIKLISSRLIDIETENSQLKKDSKKFKDEIQSLKKQVRSLEKKSESPSLPTQKLDNNNNVKNLPPKESNPSWADLATESPTTSFHETNKEQVPKINKTSTSKFTHNNTFTILNDENEDKSVIPLQEHLESHTEAATEHQTQIPYQKQPSKQQDTSRDTNIDIVLLTDSNGKFIDCKKFCPNKPVRRFYCPTIPRTIDELNKNDLGNPSHIIIHTGTNDIENSTLDSCVGDFQLMVDIASQKYPNAKILVSTLLVRADNFDSTRKSLNTKISQLSVGPNIHFINNENITKDLLHDNKHIKKRKIGLLVSNFKNTLFNRINNRRQQIKHPLVDMNFPQLFNNHFDRDHRPTQPSQNKIPFYQPPINPHHNQLVHGNYSTTTQQNHGLPPKSYAQTVVDGHAHTTQSHNGFDPETMMNLLKIYNLIQQVR